MKTNKQPSVSGQRWLLATAVGASVLLAGCATGPNANPRDPLEPYNRTMFKFNDTLDKAVLEPVATGYQNVTPKPVRIAATNFFSNLGELWSAVNNALQLKGEGTTMLGIFHDLAFMEGLCDHEFNMQEGMMA